MARYPVLNATDTEDIHRVFDFINRGSEGLFMPTILLVIWIIAFVGSLVEGRSASRAWIFASFMTLVLAILTAIMGWLETKWIYLLVILLGIGVFWIHLQKAKLS